MLEESDIEKKIFEAKEIKFNLLENKNDYILYKINKIEKRNYSNSLMNLTKYEIPLGSLPLKAEQVIKQKTIESEFLNFQYSPQILDLSLIHI
mgnify:CR=1 FL=1